MLEPLLERFRRGDRLALTRLLSLAARGEQVEAIRAAVRPTAPALVLAVTGSAGSGKSTLVGKLIEQIRKNDKRVAVLACDPQSPRSGGALLGDRFRMPSRPEDDGVFIRSLAAPSGSGAVAGHLDVMVRLLEAFGFDVVLIETVGAGQGDTIVHDLADAVVLLLQPETGDELQWEKAGLLEVADVVVVHKADLPGADRVEAQVKATLGLSASAPVPVLRVSSKTGEGLETLWRKLAACPQRRAVGDDPGRALLRLAQRTLDERFAEAQAAGDPDLLDLIARWQRGQLPPESAATALLHQLSRPVEWRAGGTVT